MRATSVGEPRVVGAAEHRAGTLTWSIARAAIPGVVLALTLLAGIVRLHGLAAPDGRLSDDESRLALAADGVLQTGTPTMLSGRVYTRGTLNSYLIAASFTLLGRSDFAARLPSALAGALLVPVVFLLGRALGGTAGGLAAACFVALANPLVDWSRQAWLPAIFLLLFTAAAYGCYRGFVEGRGRWQVAGAVLFGLALLSYEFAVLLPGALALYLVSQAAARRRGWYRGRTTLLALGLFAAGLVLFVLLALSLRAGTEAGPLGEVRRFVAPGLSLEPAAFYLDELLVGYLVLIGAAVVGLAPLARARPGGTLYLGLLTALTLLVPVFVLQSAPSKDKYMLAALPLLAVLAAGGTARLVDRAVDRLGLTAPWRVALPTLALVAVFGVALRNDLETQKRRLERPTPGRTWVQSFREQAIEPTDLIVTVETEVVQFYAGREHFVLRGGGDFLRYVYRAPDMMRSIYTNAPLLRDDGDFERYVERPNRGRKVWLLGPRDRLSYVMGRIDPNLWPSLIRSADRDVDLGDGWALIGVNLPRRTRIS